jgi:SNF2 family DNA or RNA helicase
MEPGLGKTKVTLDTAALLFERKHIRGLLIVAPNDVHSQWIEEQLPEHLPRRIKVRTAIWEASSAKRVRQCTELLKPLPNRLHVLAMNYEAFATKRGPALAKKFLQTYPSLFVADESHEIKSPKAQRTRALWKLAPLAFARRILTGTPTGGVPFDLFAQFYFLDPRILGFDSFLTFKHRYGRWQKEYARSKTQIDPNTGRPKLIEYESLIEYVHLDELYARVEPYVFRQRKQDCLDLPPKMYQTLPTHLSKAQKAVYNELLDQGLLLLSRAEKGLPVEVLSLEDAEEEELAARLPDPAGRMTMKIKLTLLLRLQQAAAGFLTDDSKQTHMIDGTWEKLPRMTATLEYIQQLLGNPGKVIVWGHFRAALEALALAARQLDVPSVMVHGGVKGEARAEAIRRFKDKDSECRLMIAHPRTLGTGQNFAVAQTCIYYTNSYSLIQRTQSEDRVHRIGQLGAVTIADVIAKDAPCDLAVLGAIKQKDDFAQKFMALNMETLRC